MKIRDITPSFWRKRDGTQLRLELRTCDFQLLRADPWQQWRLMGPGIQQDCFFPGRLTEHEAIQEAKRVIRDLLAKDLESLS